MIKMHAVMTSLFVITACIQTLFLPDTILIFRHPHVLHGLSVDLQYKSCRIGDKD